MTITIELPPATLEQVREQAKAQGKDVATFVTEAVHTRLLLRRHSFAEVAQPIAASGMTPEQAEEFFEREVLSNRKESASSAS